MSHKGFFKISQGDGVVRRIFGISGKIASLAAMYLAFGVTLFGQANVGAIVGHVSDASGAVIVGAAVSLLNPATGEKQTVETNNFGDYVFSLVRPAVYNVTVEYRGFRTVVRENVILHVAEKVSLDFTLQPGAVTQTVEVKAASPLLQPETSSIGTVIAEHTILQMPLEGRNVWTLVALVPGTETQYDYGAGQVKQDFFRLSGGAGIALNEISINGGRNLTNEFLLDDVPNTTMGYNGVAIIPPLDAVQEFNVLTNSYSAKYGRSGGGFVTAVTKAGTNDFHGTAWEFLRNDNLDANDFFANASGAKLQEFKQNQFGLTAGGPVRRNKAFFFGSYEGFRQQTGGQLFLTVPTDLQRKGDFSQTFRQDGSLFQIYDPFTTRFDSASGTFQRDQFMGCDGKTPNVICSDRFDPVAGNLLQFFPEPNLPGDPVTHANNFISQAGSTQLTDAFQVRLDHNFTERQRFFGRFSWDRQHFNPANVLGNSADFNANPFLNRHRGLTLSYTNALNPTTVLNIRYGLVRERQLNSSGSAGFDITSIGLPASLKTQLESPVFPRFDIGGFTSLGTQFFTLVDRANTTQTLAANLSKVIGRHSIEAGVDLRVIQGALYQPGWPSGQFAFDTGFTNGPDPFGGFGNGSGFASFLLGTTSFGDASYDPHWYFTNRYYASYFQDDIKVSRKLTLNLGLRYDYEAPLEDRHNQLSFLDFQHDIPISVTPVDTSQPDVNTGATVPPDLAASLGLGLRPVQPFHGGGAGFPGVNGIGKGVSLPDRNDWGPRVGLAYSITPKTVIRTAYGIIYPGTTADNSGNFPTIQGFNPQTSTLTAPDGLTPFNLPGRAYLLSDPFPNGLRPVDGSRLGLLTSLGSSDTGFLRNDRHAYFQQWNFGIQRELPGNLLVEAAYVGSHSVHLQDYAGVQYDALPDKYLALGNSLFHSIPNPFFGVLPADTSLGASSTTTRYQLLLPYPEFTGLNGQAGHRTSSTYNGFQLKVQKRMSQGLSFLAAYTASKTLDDDSSTNGWVINVFPRVTGHQDLNNLRLDHSLSAQDRSQVLVLSSIYELPFGRGKPLGAVANPVASHLISGWQVGSILSFATGFPLGIACVVCGYPANRPNLAGNPNAGIHGSNESRLNRWFNTDAFAVNVPFSYGTTPRLLPNTRGPGQANMDFSMVKDTRISERYNIQFRAEFFNFLNRPLFDQPDMAFGSTTFGVITRQANIPRQIQLGLKIYW